MKDRFGLKLLHAHMQVKLSTPEGMASFLDELVGRENWRHDAAENVWVIPDPQHKGAGKGYMVLRLGGSWFSAVFPDDSKFKELPVSPA